ncbi:hypothetical protein F5Y19DRAFT_442588 [Xylariaceae sp. FL1651]|nr:hypothetical protein F5Y19DRAFT_442588 [Xylariaceae sp. FL1651]
MTCLANGRDRENNETIYLYIVVVIVAVPALVSTYQTSIRHSMHPAKPPEDPQKGSNSGICSFIKGLLKEG